MKIQENEKFNHHQILYWTNELINGIYYLHYNKIQKCVHRNLIPCNIFLTHDDHVKIGNLSISRPIDDDSTLNCTTDGLGTYKYLKYMSPEMRDHGSYSYNSDIWFI